MKKEKKKKSSALLGMVVCVLLGAGLGFFLAEATAWLFGDGEMGIIPLLLMLAAFFLCLLIHVVLHELGHLIFGLLTGYRFSSFRILHFMWVKIDGKTHCKRLSLAGTAGQCLMLPPPLKEGKIPTVWYNLGGAIFNVFVSALCLGLVFLCKSVPYLALVLLIFAATGFLVGLSNGIPMRVGQIDNDGRNALALRKNEKAIFAFWLQLQVNGVLTSGKRLREMPEEWFIPPAQEDMENGMLATQGVFAENYYMDCRRFAEAKALGERLLDPKCGTIGVHADLLRCDLTYIALAIDGDKDEAERLWTKELVAFQKTMKNFPTVLRTQYARALLFEGDEEKAEGILKRFEEVAKSYPYAADIVAERELFTLAWEKRDAAVPCEGEEKGE